MMLQDLPDDVIRLIVSAYIQEAMQPGRPGAVLPFVRVCKSFKIGAYPLIYRSISLAIQRHRICMLKRTLQDSPYIAAFVQILFMFTANEDMVGIISTCRNLRRLACWPLTHSGEPRIDLSNHTQLRWLSCDFKNLGMKPCNPTPPAFLANITHLDLDCAEDTPQWLPLLPLLPSVTHLFVNFNEFLPPNDPELCILSQFMGPNIRVCIVFIQEVTSEFEALGQLVRGTLDPRIVVAVQFWVHEVSLKRCMLDLDDIGSLQEDWLGRSRGVKPNFWERAETIAINRSTLIHAAK